ncbi:hypothetical protein [Streptomyces sp. IBSBF 2435]|uniref:hypothetical protein n=1 Tax=Streptomyces sp. IBSBF 2435 TaxID=2903531 RepID=UPI003FA7A4CA
MLRYHVLDGVRRDTEREVFLGDWIAGRRPGGIPPGIRAIIDRHARPTVVLDSFFRGLLDESKKTAFPAAEIVRHLGAGATASSRSAPASGLTARTGSAAATRR